MISAFSKEKMLSIMNCLRAKTLSYQLRQFYLRYSTFSVQYFFAFNNNIDNYNNHDNDNINNNNDNNNDNDNNNNNINN